jgi:Ni/Fe-hydrogenase subunit HybB-like protein
VRGALALLVYGLIGSAWFLAGVLGLEGVIAWLALPGALAGAAAAGYTAFLFAQCEGRDLWQSPLLLPVLLAQATAAGAAGILLAAPLLDLDPAAVRAAEWTLAGGIGTALALYLAEVASHATRNVEAAVVILTRGPERVRYWAGIGLAVVAVVLAVLGLGVPAGAAALVSLVSYEHAYVRAGQLVPLS